MPARLCDCGLEGRGGCDGKPKAAMGITAQLLTAATLAWLEAERSLRCGGRGSGFSRRAGSHRQQERANVLGRQSCVSTAAVCVCGGGEVLAREGGGCSNESCITKPPLPVSQLTPATENGNATASYLGQCWAVPTTACYCRRFACYSAPRPATHYSQQPQHRKTRMCCTISRNTHSG